MTLRPSDSNRWSTRSGSQLGPELPFGAVAASRLSGALAAAVLASLAAAASGCTWGDGGPPNPLPSPSVAPTTDVDAGPVDPPDAAVPLRTVGWRSPLGVEPRNLLVDGDFELSAVWPGSQPQTGWIAVSGGGSNLVTMTFETGGLCRTGLRCAVLDRGTIFFGQGTSASGRGMTAGLWVRVPDGRGCDVVDAYVLPCSFGNNGRQLEPVTPEADPQGWCQYQAAIPERNSASCMYIESSLVSDERALLDSATLLPEDAPPAPVAAPRPLEAALLDRYAAVADLVRRRRIVGRPIRPAGSMVGTNE